MNNVFRNHLSLFNKACIFLFIVAVNCRADIYKYTDNRGRIFYTEEPRNGQYILIIKSRPTKLNNKIKSVSAKRTKVIENEIKLLLKNGHNLIDSTPEDIFSKRSNSLIERFKHEKNIFIKEAEFKAVVEDQDIFITELYEISKSLLDKRDEKMRFQRNKSKLKK